MSEKTPYDNSQICQYRKCPMSYYLRYVKNLRKSDQADIDTLHLDFGKAYHDFLEQYYKRKMNKTSDKIDLTEIWNKFIDREGESVKTRENGVLLSKAYISHYENKDSFKILDVEKPIEIDLSGYRFIVKRDGVIKESDNIYTLEHKTTSRLTNYYFTSYFINSQISAQTYVTLQEYGQCSGVMLNVAQPAFITKPVLLTVGDPDITAYSNVDVKYCKYYKEDRAYCSGFTAKFERDIISRTTDEVNDWKDNTIAWINEIERSRQDNRWLKNDSGWECKSCQFKELCKVSHGTKIDECIADVLYEEYNPFEYLELEGE